MACSWALLFSACARCLAFFLAFLRMAPMTDLRSRLFGLRSSHRSSGADRRNHQLGKFAASSWHASRRPGVEQCALPDGNAVAALIWASTARLTMRGPHVPLWSAKGLGRPAGTKAGPLSVTFGRSPLHTRRRAAVGLTSYCGHRTGNMSILRAVSALLICMLDGEARPCITASGKRGAYASILPSCGLMHSPRRETRASDRLMLQH